MKTAEEVFEELEKALKPYSDIISDLELFKLNDQQISSVLMLIYSYRFGNALKLSEGRDIGDDSDLI